MVKSLQPTALEAEAQHLWWLIRGLREARCAGDTERCGEFVEILEFRTRFSDHPAIRTAAQRALPGRPYLAPAAVGQASTAESPDPDRPA